MVLLLLIAIILLADLTIKSAIEEADPKEFPKEMEGTKGLVMLHRNHNSGFPMGVLKNRPDLVKTIPLAVISAVGGVFVWLYPRKGHVAEKLGAAMVLGGGLSNLYDRMKRGYVVDYFSVNVKELKEVVFNLGDTAIFLGSAIMLVAELIGTIRES